MKIKFLSAIFIPWSKWLLKNGYINIWLTGWLVAEWMNEGLNFFSLWKLLHFFLCQWAIFWSYSKYSLGYGWLQLQSYLAESIQFNSLKTFCPWWCWSSAEFLGCSVSEPQSGEAIFSKPVHSVLICWAPTRSPALFLMHHRWSLNSSCYRLCHLFFLEISSSLGFCHISFLFLFSCFSSTSIKICFLFNLLFRPCLGSSLRLSFCPVFLLCSGDSQLWLRSQALGEAPSMDTFYKNFISDSDARLELRTAFIL